MGDYSQKSSLTNTEIYDYYQLLPDLQRSLNFYSRIAKKSDKLLTPKDCAAMHFLFSEVSQEDADEFMEKLMTGIGLERDTPISLLRSKLIKTKMDPNFKLTHKAQIQNLVYAWNKFRKGEKLKTLKVSPTFQIEIL